MPPRGVGLNPNTYPHFTDHLAVLCIALGAPLLFTDVTAAAEAEALYPGLKTAFLAWENFTPDDLVREYDFLLQCDYWPRYQLRAALDPYQKKYAKRLRNIHCPHGFSDKIFWLQRVVEEDVTLIYGPNMIRMLEEQGVWGKIGDYVVTGNSRFGYYKQHEAFYKGWVEENVLTQFSAKRPLIFYAPTWGDQEDSSSFMDAIHPLLETLPSHFNLAIKLHPRIQENHPIEVDTFLHPYRNHPNIAFIDNTPLVYPLLAAADIYLGDRSSIGYDFLPFNRPMFFLNQSGFSPESDRRAHLLQCGTVIAREDYKETYRHIEDALQEDQQRYSALRAEVYRDTFGEERALDAIRADLHAMCS